MEGLILGGRGELGSKPGSAASAGAIQGRSFLSLGLRPLSKGKMTFRGLLLPGQSRSPRLLSGEHCLAHSALFFLLHMIP